MQEAKIRVAISGAAGSMGRQVAEAVLGAADMSVAALVDPAFGPAPTDSAPLGAESPAPDLLRFSDLESALGAVQADVVVDFTVAAAARANVAIALSHRVPAVVGTTGLTQDDLETWQREAESTGTPVLLAPNFAIGAVLMMLFAEQAARHLDACEIVELHHDRKRDAPSGTAKRTEEMVRDVWKSRGLDRHLPIHSVRLPGLVAHQEVIYGGLGQTLTIRHDSISRESFMPGVLLAVRRIRDRQGLTVGLENLL